MKYRKVLRGISLPQGDFGYTSITIYTSISVSGIKIAWRNIHNLRYADDTTLMAESKELKSLLMKVKQEE